MLAQCGGTEHSLDHCRKDNADGTEQALIFWNIELNNEFMPHERFRDILRDITVSHSLTATQ